MLYLMQKVHKQHGSTLVLSKDVCLIFIVTNKYLR